jgi:hypothetical protein
VLRPIAEEIGAEMLLPTGESSDTMIYGMAARAAEDGRPLAVLYFGDFDPSGNQMAISVARKLQAVRDLYFPDLRAEVHRVALTLDQVIALDLPESVLKETESRGESWREATGREQTEIDALAALRPDVLDQIAREAVRPFYDSTLARRARIAEEQWSTTANEWLQALPEYEAARVLLHEQHAIVMEAIDAFDEQREAAIALVTDAFERAEDVPEAPDDVPLEITAEAPEPLFTTDDDYTTASHRLIADKALENMRREGGGA